MNSRCTAKYCLTRMHVLLRTLWFSVLVMIALQCPALAQSNATVTVDSAHSHSSYIWSRLEMWRFAKEYLRLAAKERYPRSWSTEDPAEWMLAKNTNLVKLYLESEEAKKEYVDLKEFVKDSFRFRKIIIRSATPSERVNKLAKMSPEIVVTTLKGERIMGLTRHGKYVQYEKLISRDKFDAFDPKKFE